ncbi:TPA: universal stress protein [Morganella morganii]|nr:universal stress protein [Morganella morganii]
MYNTILVPIDILEDDLTDKMLPHVEALAKIDNPKIHFFTVIPNVEMFFGVEYASMPVSMRESGERIELALAALKEIIKGIAVPKTQYTLHAAIGSAKNEILSYAKEINADLILMGSHRPGAATFLLGSTAATIVRHAKTSVMVIR